MNDDNKQDMHHQEDVKPGSALEKLVNNDLEGHAPVLDGTGSNHPVPTESSLVIKDENDEEGAES